jgi:hypothetical protein
MAVADLEAKGVEFVAPISEQRWGRTSRLPEKYTRQIYAQKCDAVYQHVFESYFDDGHSVYDLAAKPHRHP